jgi:hypothetical protein
MKDVSYACNRSQQGRRTISRLYFDIQIYMFRTDLLSIVRSLDTVLTATGSCHISYVDCLLPSQTR